VSEIEYANLTGRPRGRFVRAASLVVPGIRRVQDQVEPYAARWHEWNRTALQRSGPLWVALGDSMTLGMGAGRFDGGWVGQLYQQLGDHHYRLINLAASGARVDDVLNQQLPALESLGVEPDLVTVLVGSNDLMQRSYRAELANNFAELLERLPDRTVVANLPGGQPHAVQIDHLIRAAAPRIVLADMRTPRTSSWRGKLADDRFHPNEDGYADLAAVFARAIEQSRSDKRS
jgi:lysophospholipase L1-like esterase